TAIDNVLAPLRTAKKWMKRIKGLATTSLNMVTVLKGELTGFVSTTTDFINYPKAYMNDLQSALSLTSLSSKSSVSNNPGSYASTSSDVTGVAGIIMADWKSGNTSLQEVAALPEKLITGQTTSAVATPSGSSVSDIAELVTATRIQVALQLATDASDILSDESVITLLSPDDVEQIAGDTRKAIQQAIDLTRELFADDTQAVSSSVSASGVTWQPVVNGLKDIALAVQELGTSVITQRPPLTTRTVEADCNLHLLAHLWYADYSRASELLRLNPTLRNPNALKAGDELNAYSR
ncbi:multidrug DMT transporter permease, partial [Salmonella enterica subsp. enterica serovar Kentucky]|nr:multidrug DMT transporter permease [Salmonella enterica subsp. enterica serovar Kentucky]